MVFLVFSEVADEIFVDEVEENFVDVKFKSEEQKGRKDVLALHLPYYLLNESNLVELPLDCLGILV